MVVVQRVRALRLVRQLVHRGRHLGRPLRGNGWARVRQLGDLSVSGRHQGLRADACRTLQTWTSPKTSVLGTSSHLRSLDHVPIGPPTCPEGAGRAQHWPGR